MTGVSTPTGQIPSRLDEESARPSLAYPGCPSHTYQMSPPKGSGLDVGGAEVEPWQYLPNPWRRHVAGLSKEERETLEEIRFRVGRPVFLYGPAGHRPLTGEGVAEAVAGEEIERVFAVLIDYSLYARADELRQGFVTLPGGHRVGVVARAVVEKGAVETVRHICGLNIRWARPVVGGAASLWARLGETGGGLPSVLLLSPPRCGKTTLLRDLVRQLGDRGFRTVVVDERSEIGGAGADGAPGYPVGLHTDVLDAWPKAVGIQVALRTLGPDVIAVDELGAAEDCAAVERARLAGVAVLATVHGGSLADLADHPQLSRMLARGVFDRVVVLSRRRGPGTVERVCAPGDWDRSEL